MSNLFFPVIELVDRLAIAELKFEKTGSNQAELDWYQAQAKLIDLTKINDELADLKEIHREIWMLEADLKSMKEHLHSLEEIGRRAIKIRDLNNQRIRLKNQMAKLLNCSVREIKQDHLSQ